MTGALVAREYGVILRRLVAREYGVIFRRLIAREYEVILRLYLCIPSLTGSHYIQSVVFKVFQ